MTRQLDKKKEEKEARRRVALVKALEFELADNLDLAGITLLGFAVKWDAFECLMTVKADIGGVRHVAFVGSDSVINAIIKATVAAKYDRLRWKEDVYKPSVI